MIIIIKNINIEGNVNYVKIFVDFIFNIIKKKHI